MTRAMAAKAILWFGICTSPIWVGAWMFLIWSWVGGIGILLALATGIAAIWLMLAHICGAFRDEHQHEAEAYAAPEGANVLSLRGRR